MLAFTLGNPPGPASRSKPSRLSRRPLTSMRSPWTVTKCWTSSKKRSMSKKLPLKTNANGMVGKPAEPTVAPGGSVAVAACVAGAGALGVVEPLVDEDEDDDDE